MGKCGFCHLRAGVVSVLRFEAEELALGRRPAAKTSPAISIVACLSSVSA